MTEEERLLDAEIEALRRNTVEWTMVLQSGEEVRALIHEAEEGGYWAEVPQLPGCFTEGETLDEIKANVLEAVECWLEGALEENR